MKDEEMIKQIAEHYEVPVEQVALIWSVVKYSANEWYDTSNPNVVGEVVEYFIQEKMA